MEAEDDGTRKTLLTLLTLLTLREAILLADLRIRYEDEAMPFRFFGERKARVRWDDRECGEPFILLRHGSPPGERTGRGVAEIGRFSYLLP